jgi:hypothetical protein
VGHPILGERKSSRVSVVWATRQTAIVHSTSWVD